MSRECPLCLDTPREPVLTPCGHVLCLACLQLAMHTCPVCRAPCQPGDTVLLDPSRHRRADSAPSHSVGVGGGGVGGGRESPSPSPSSSPSAPAVEALDARALLTSEHSHVTSSKLSWLVDKVGELSAQERKCVVRGEWRERMHLCWTRLRVAVTGALLHTHTPTPSPPPHPRHPVARCSPSGRACWTSARWRCGARACPPAAWTARCPSTSGTWCSSASASPAARPACSRPCGPAAWGSTW